MSTPENTIEPEPNDVPSPETQALAEQQTPEKVLVRVITPPNCTSFHTGSIVVDRHGILVSVKDARNLAERAGAFNIGLRIGN